MGDCAEAQSLGIGQIVVLNFKVFLFFIFCGWILIEFLDMTFKVVWVGLMTQNFQKNKLLITNIKN